MPSPGHCLPLPLPAPCLASCIPHTNPTPNHCTRLGTAALPFPAVPWKSVRHFAFAFTPSLSPPILPNLLLPHIAHNLHRPVSHRQAFPYSSALRWAPLRIQSSHDRLQEIQWDSLAWSIRYGLAVIVTRHSRGFCRWWPRQRRRQERGGHHNIGTPRSSRANLFGTAVHVAVVNSSSPTIDYGPERSLPWPSQPPT